MEKFGDKQNAVLESLWEETRSGSEQAFGLIHTRLYPGLFAYAYRMLGDEAIVDDLLQDLFVKFWQNSGHIGVIQNVKGYFYRSTRSIVLNHIKSQAIKLGKLERMPVPDIEFSKEEMIISHEHNQQIRESLHKAINTLPKKQRESVYLRFYENLEYLQIAEITGIRYQSVINHVYRAMQTLKEVAELKHVYAA